MSYLIVRWNSSGPRFYQAVVEGVASDRATFVTAVLPETGSGSMPSTEITSYKRASLQCLIS
jgi:hypothetical protein